MSSPKTPYRQTPRVTAILPTNSITKAIEFFSRLGFKITYPKEPSAVEDYCILLHPNLSEIHLNAAEPGFLVEGKNPCGLYVYTPDVDKIAKEFQDDIIVDPNSNGGTAKPEHKPWKMYEFSINGPDGTLVRVGWPSDEMTGEELKKQEEEHT